MTAAPDDPFDLKRFVDAQTPVYGRVVEELSAGEKRSHWMWFVFPQIAGLGHSPLAQRYAIRSLDEARAYCRHPVLGPRLRDCTRLVNAVEGRSLTAILGSVDAMKFRSSMTLFVRADEDPVFDEALARHCGGAPDPATLAQLGR